MITGNENVQDSAMDKANQSSLQYIFQLVQILQKMNWLL